MHNYTKAGSNRNNQTAPTPSGLTLGGREIWRRTRREVATCNVLATLAGLGSEVRHG